MDGEYEVVVLGTGFKECLLGGLLSTEKKKVLHLDKNSFYGGLGASLNLAQLFKKFRPSEDGSDEKIPPALGLSQKYAVDLCPKFVMASGPLIKILLHTGARQLLDFRSIQGCYVLSGKKMHRVPSSAKEALKSSLLGKKQKNCFRKFLTWVESYDANNATTHEGNDLTTMTAEDLYKKYGLEDSTVHFTGRCIALEVDDTYLKQPALDLVKRIKKYAYSTVKYGKSPFIYPLWGIGGLPEAFSRTCAINGGIFMLNKPIKEVVFGDDGKVTGVTDMDDKTVATKCVIADPSYFAGTDKVNKVGRVARAVLLLDEKNRIKGVDGDSGHIVLPAGDCDRKSDVYISYVSDKHMVCPEGKFVLVCSALAEGDENTSSTEEELVKAELQAAFNMIGDTLETFCWFTDLLVPNNDADEKKWVLHHQLPGRYRRFWDCNRRGSCIV